MLTNRNPSAIHHEIVGPPARRRALLIPGTGCSSATWSPELVTGLVDCGLQVVLYDPRDTGSSFRTGDDEPYTLWDLADEAATVLEATATSTVPAIVVGYSLGGAVAQCLAVRRPDLVEGLVLLGTPARPGRGLEIGPEGPATSTTNWDDRDAALATLIRSMGKHDAHDVEWATELFRGRQVPMTADGVRRHAAAALATVPPSDDELASIRVPVLIVNGAHDDSIPPANAHAIAGDIPGARLEIIESMGHWPKPRDVQVIITRIADHLGSVAACSTVTVCSSSRPDPGALARHGPGSRDRRDGS